MSREEKTFAARPPEEIAGEENQARTDDRSVIGDVDRRTFLRLSALAGAGASLAGAVSARPASAVPAQPGGLEEATVAQLQAQMAAGTLNSVALTNFYISRILTLDQNGP